MPSRIVCATPASSEGRPVAIGRCRTSAHKGSVEHATSR
jgi:hypothetical protein